MELESNCFELFETIFELVRQNIGAVMLEKVEVVFGASSFSSVFYLPVLLHISRRNSRERK